MIAQGGPGCAVFGPLAGAACSAAGSVASSAAGSVASTVSSDALTSAAQFFAKMITHVLKLLATAWVSIPSPFTSANGGAAQDGTTVWLGNQLQWLVGVSLILGTIAACGIAAWKAGRGRQIGEDVDRMGMALLRVIVVAGAGAVFIGLFMAMGDGFAKWILQTAGTDWAGPNAKTFTAMARSDPPLVIVLGVLVAIAGFIQIVVVAGIAVILPILVGLWPCSAALSATEGGTAVWKKHTGWIVAAILFKPVAAIIYAVAFKMMSGTVACPAGVTCDAQSVGDLSLIFGLLLLVFAVLAMPALMRLVVPAVGAIGGISGGEAVGAGLSLATGAVLLASGGAGAAAGGGGAMESAAGNAGPAGSMGLASETGGANIDGGGAASGGGGAGAGPTGPGSSGGSGGPAATDGAGGGQGPGGGVSPGGPDETAAAGAEPGASGAAGTGSSGGSPGGFVAGAGLIGDGADQGTGLAEGAIPTDETGA